MYNGIGLQTARGTGTNGFVTRNLSYVRVTKEKIEYKPDEDLKKLESYINKKGNAELLLHERKRKVELRCAEMEDLMTEQGYSAEEIERKVTKFRKQQLEKSEKEEEKKNFSFDEYGRPIGNESHQIAEATEFKNRKLREAFGLGEFDPVTKAKQTEEERRLYEEKAKEMKSKKYQWVDEDDLNDDQMKNYKPGIRHQTASRDENLRISRKPEEDVVDEKRSAKKLSKKKSKRNSSSSGSSDEDDRKKNEPLKEKNSKRKRENSSDRERGKKSNEARKNVEEKIRQDSRNLERSRSQSPNRRKSDKNVEPLKNHVQQAVPKIDDHSASNPKDSSLTKRNVERSRSRSPKRRPRSPIRRNNRNRSPSYDRDIRNRDDTQRYSYRENRRVIEKPGAKNEIPSESKQIEKKSSRKISDSDSDSDEPKSGKRQISSVVTRKVYPNEKEENKRVNRSRSPSSSSSRSTSSDSSNSSSSSTSSSSSGSSSHASR